jgi:hypothetical protein
LAPSSAKLAKERDNAPIKAKGRPFDNVPLDLLVKTFGAQLVPFDVNQEEAVFFFRVALAFGLTGVRNG